MSYAHVQAADRSRAHDHDDVSQARAQPSVSRQHRTGGFGQRAFHEIHPPFEVVHNTVLQDLPSQDHFFGKPARISGGDANQAQVITQVKAPSLAIITMPAVYIRGYGQPITHGEAPHLGANFHNNARDLMPGKDVLALGRSFFPAPQIRTADPAGHYPQHQPVWRQRRFRHFPDFKNLRGDQESCFQYLFLTADFVNTRAGMRSLPMRQLIAYGSTRMGLTKHFFGVASFLQENDTQCVAGSAVDQ